MELVSEVSSSIEYKSVVFSDLLHLGGRRAQDHTQRTRMFLYQIVKMRKLHDNINFSLNALKIERFVNEEKKKCLKII